MIGRETKYSPKLEKADITVLLMTKTVLIDSMYYLNKICYSSAVLACSRGVIPIRLSILVEYIAITIFL